MSSVVFILGAGASAECGAPLIRNFLDVARDLMQSNRIQNRSEQFKQVFNAISAMQVVHSKARLDLTNIESILGFRAQWNVKPG